MLSDLIAKIDEDDSDCLNAPSGAGCFLTLRKIYPPHKEKRLNAPSGAGCFLTGSRAGRGRERIKS